MSKQTTNSIIIFFTLLIIGLSVYFVIMPEYKKVSANREKIKNLETTYQQDKKQIAEIKDNEKYYNETIKDADKINELIPSQKNIDNFVIQLEEIAKRSNNGFTSIQITTPTAAQPKQSSGSGSTGESTSSTSQSKSSTSESQTQDKAQSKSTSGSSSTFTQTAKNGDFYTISFDLLVSGSFTSICDYLSLIEHINRFVTLNKVSIQSGTANNLESTISGTIYIKP